MLNAWGHVAASRWVGAPAPSTCPDSGAGTGSTEERMRAQTGDQKTCPQSHSGLGQGPRVCTPPFQGPRESYRMEFLGQATFPRSLTDPDATRSTRCPESSQLPHVLPWGTGLLPCGLRPWRLF